MRKGHVPKTHRGVKDITAHLQRELRSDIRAALRALETLKQHFGRETVSAAIGEISEVLVAKFTRAERVKRGGRGHDLVDRYGGLIEVKARLPGDWGDSRQYNFGKHSARASEVFCIAWSDNPLAVSHAFRLPISVLRKRWGRQAGRYCARVNLRQLKAACDQHREKTKFSKAGK